MASDIDPFSMLEVSLQEREEDAVVVVGATSTQSARNHTMQEGTKVMSEMMPDVNSSDTVTASSFVLIQEATDVSPTLFNQAGPSLPPSTSSSPISPGRTSAKGSPSAEILSLNISADSPYALPFDYGWKREVVQRLNSTTTRADIYYFTPAGKKCRSLKEIEKELQGDTLTLANFLFGKKVLGINDPSKEILRLASDRNIQQYPKPSTADHKASKRKLPLGKPIPHMNGGGGSDEVEEKHMPDTQEVVPGSTQSANAGPTEAAIAQPSQAVLTDLTQAVITGPSNNFLFSLNFLPVDSNSVILAVKQESEEEESFSVQDSLAPTYYNSAPLVVQRCSCGMCSNLDEKSFCCCDVANIKSVKTENNQCITLHPSFEKLVLDPDVLSVSRQILCTKTFHKDKKKFLSSPTSPSNVWRYLAYKQFVYWINASFKIGSKDPVAIPSCVVEIVKLKYPGESDDRVNDNRVAFI